jgi:hypothetical protein
MSDGRDIACSIGPCQDECCDACVPDGARDRVIGTLAMVAGRASRWARELVRVAERLRP